MNLIFSVLPDGTRINEDGVGVSHRINLSVSVFFHNAGHQLGIGHIHLTAVGLHIIVFHNE